MRPTRSTALTAFAASGLLLTPISAEADLITEYFNNYGTSNEDLPGNGSATDPGWGSDWTGDTDVDYQAGQQLDFTSAGYSTTGNETDSDDGRANRGGTGDVARTFDSAFTSGTLWLTALIRSDASATSTPDIETVPDRDTRLFLDGTTNDVTFGEFNANPYLNVDTNNFFGDPDTNDAANELDRFGTYLLIVKAELDATGFDTVSFWVATDDSDTDENFDADTSSQTEAGLGTPLLTDTGEIGSITGLGISFNKQGQADILRISDASGDAGLQQVLTGVPEPASAALLAAGGLCLLPRRRR
jgi:hypothetical protein